MPVILCEAKDLRLFVLVLLRPAIYANAAQSKWRTEELALKESA